MKLRVSVLCLVADGSTRYGLVKGCSEGGCGNAPPNQSCASSVASITLYVETAEAGTSKVASAPMSRVGVERVINKMMPELVEGSGMPDYYRTVDFMFYLLEWGMYSAQDGCLCDWPQGLQICEACCDGGGNKTSRFYVCEVTV